MPRRKTLLYDKKKLHAVMERVCAWGNQFIKTSFYESLTEEQKDASESVVLSVTENIYVTYGMSPEEWDESALEEICVRTLPEKLIACQEYFESVAPILSAFLEFAADKGLIENGTELAKKCRAMHEQIVENAANPDAWSGGKILIQDAIEDGIDITNQEELDTYVKKREAQQLTREHSGKFLESSDVFIRDLPPTHGNGKKNAKTRAKEKKTQEKKSGRKKKAKGDELDNQGKRRISC
jgi:hypothetical protein